MSGELLISYRRQDSAGYAGRVIDDLRRRFGEATVRFSGDDIARDAAADATGFAEALEREIGRCEVMLVLIGPQWSSAQDASGRRRLDDPDDFVRREIAAALAADLPVIPVLVGGAYFPPQHAFPSDISALAGRQAIELSEGRWREGIELVAQSARRFLSQGATAGTPNLESGPAPRPPLEARRRKARYVDPDVMGKMRRTAASFEARQQDKLQATDARSAAAAAAHTFISYAFEDQEWARAIVAALESDGCKCWIAPRDIPPGTPSYARAITKAIKASRIMIVIVSEHSNASEDVLNEITLAKNNKVTRLPFRIDASALDEGFEYYFSQSQWLNAADLSEDEALQALIASVIQR